MDLQNEQLGIDLVLEDGELTLSSSGDLAITADGRRALLQDIAHLLETLPGDLFSHPDFGAGLGRLVGDSPDRDLRALIERSIVDAITCNPAIACGSRILLTSEIIANPDT